MKKMGLLCMRGLVLEVEGTDARYHR
jgi:hypothetical protein